MDTKKSFSYGKLYAALLSLGAATALVGGPASAANLTGYLNNTGHTLYIGAGQPNAGLNMAGGWIRGGILQSDAASANLFTQTGSQGTLDNVVLNGSLDVTGEFSVAHITGGISLHDAAGSGPGTVNVTGGNAWLYFDGDQTLDHATLNLGSAFNFNPSYLAANGPTTLTLGANLNLQANSTTYLQGYAIDNQGSLLVNSGTTHIANDFFTNHGVVTVGSYATLDNASTASTNFGTITGGENTVIKLAGQFINAADGQINVTGFAGFILNPPVVVLPPPDDIVLLPEPLITPLDAPLIPPAEAGGSLSLQASSVQTQADNESFGSSISSSSVIIINPGPIVWGSAVLQLGTEGTHTADASQHWSNAGVINASNADVRLGGYFTPADIGTLNRTGGTLSLNGYLENDGATLQIGAGQAAAGLNLKGGVIHGGTIQSDAASANLFTQSGATGTLDGVTLNGSLDVTGNSSQATVVNGITLHDVAGTGPGTVNLTGDFAWLRFEGSQTLDNATLNLGNISNYNGSYLSANEGAKLTLGENLNIQANGTASLQGDTINNQGSIEVNTGATYITPANFTNHGSIAAATGTTLTTYTNSFANHGSITGADGSTVNLGGQFTNAADGLVQINGAGGTTVLQLGSDWTNSADPAQHWTNAGIINANNADVRLGGYFTAADIGSLNRSGGTLSLNGYLDNSGDTLQIGSGQAFADLQMAGGTIHGGTIQSDDASANLFTHHFSIGTLDGVALNGTLDVTADFGNATIVNGITLRDAAGTGPGTVNVTGFNASLHFSGDQTLDNATLNLGNWGDYYYGPSALKANGTLTLGANLNLQANGYAVLQGNAIDNQGSLSVNSGETYLAPNSFNNQGTVAVASGALLKLGDGHFGAATPVTANHGSITGADGSTLYLLGQFDNAADGLVEINGAGGATTLQLGYSGVNYADPSQRWSNAGIISALDATVWLGGYFTAADLAGFHRSGGSLGLIGYLDNSGNTLQIGAGQDATGLGMMGGTIHGGTIQSDAASANLFTQNYAQGTLDGVTLNGSLDLTGYYSQALITGGLSLHDTAGNGPGTLNVTGDSAGLFVTNGLALDNGTLNLGQSGNAGTSFVHSYDSTELTLGSSLNLNANGNASLTGYAIGNYGNIQVQSGTTTIKPTYFSNHGTVAVDSGATLNLSNDYYYYGLITNHGSINAEDGSTLTLSGQFTNAADGQVNVNGTGGVTVLQLGNPASWNNHWSNTGVINATNADVRLGGYFTQADVGNLNRSGGTLSLNGYLDNSGTTLQTGAGQALAGLKMAGGTIHGGTIQSDAATANLFTQHNASGTLDGVTLNGSLDLTGAYSQAFIVNGISLHDAAGSGPGTLNVTGDAASLDFSGYSYLTSLDNATLNLGKAGSSSYLRANYSPLTLGANLNLQANGSAYLQGIAIDNQGSIHVNSGTTEISPNSFTNSGSLTAAAGTNVNVQSAIFANTGQIGLDNASFQANGFTNAGSISGSGNLTVLGQLVNAGTISPGTAGSVGQLNLNGDFSQTATGVLDFSLESGSSYDVLNIGGNVLFDGTLRLENLGAYVPHSGDLLTLMTFGGQYLGGVFNLDSSAFAGLGFSLVYDAHAVALRVDAGVAPVPIPAAGWLMGSGLLGLLGFGTRRRCNKGRVTPPAQNLTDMA